MTKDEKEVLQDVVDTTKRIERALIGDHELGIPGIVDEVKKNTKHRQRVNKAALLAGGSSVAGGASYPWWDKILDWFT